MNRIEQIKAEMAALESKYRYLKRDGASYSRSLYDAGHHKLHEELEELKSSNCKCGNDATHKCNDTPNGGWGTMKCGEKLCDNCKCGCTSAEVF